MKTEKRKGSGCVNVAVVGLGWMGITHLKAYEAIPAARVAAIVCHTRLPVNGVLAGISGNVGGADNLRLAPDVKVFQRLDEALLDPAIDLVDICVPTTLHPEMAMAALRAGKHVLCEKPLARTSAAAKEIVAMAEKSGAYLMPAMCMRFWPGWALLKELVDNRTYGEVLAARFRRVSSPPDRSRNFYFDGVQSGGALLDLHIHDSDFVQFLFGRPLRVFSTGRTRYSGAIDYVVTQYKVACGATVHAEGGWLMTRGFSMSFTVNFERATFDFDSTRGADALRIDEPHGDTRFVRFEEPDGYTGQARYIVECIGAGQAPVIATPADGLSAIEICEAEELSVRIRQPVELIAASGLQTTI
jgi:predicted dehydrogenase